jgi:hypothetical protein
MQEQPPEATSPAAAVGVAARPRRPLPSSSRMFARYLTDVEQLLDDRRWEAAWREAADLPRIAVALSDPQLQCASDRATVWCQEWVRPPGAERDAHGLDSERVGRAVCEHIAQSATPVGVPTRALRRLRLRRHLRAPPRGFSARQQEHLSAEQTSTRELCNALVQAARRWYARSACHDATVQANLARLAVLR